MECVCEEARHQQFDFLAVVGLQTKKIAKYKIGDLKKQQKNRRFKKMTKEKKTYGFKSTRRLYTITPTAEYAKSVLSMN